MPNKQQPEIKVLLLILMLAAVATFLLAVFVKPRPMPDHTSADTSPAQSWTAEEQCQFYNKWCYTWPNCGPCVDGKPVHADGWLDAQAPANSVKF
jgi:hypothetical protein